MSAMALRVLLTSGFGLDTGGKRRRIDGFFAQAAEALGAHPALDLTLLGAHAPRPPASGSASTVLHHLAVIARRRPHVVMTGDAGLLRCLTRLRPLTRVPFRAVYSNGTTFAGPFGFADAVHQLTRTNLDHALEAGEPPERQFFMPCGFKVPSGPPPDDAAKALMRRKLGLPAEGLLLLAPLLPTPGEGNISRGENVSGEENVPRGEGAFGSNRLSVLLAAMAMLPQPRPHLVLLGAADERQARTALGDGVTVRALRPQGTGIYFTAADGLVITSSGAGSARLLVEGLGRGLPVLADDGPYVRGLGGAFVRRGDFSTPGEITACLHRLWPDDDADVMARWQHVRALGWSCLADRYAAMLHEMAALPLRRNGHARRTRRIDPPKGLARAGEIGSGLGIAP